jgi:hypothetical protein
MQFERSRLSSFLPLAGSMLLHASLLLLVGVNSTAWRNLSELSAPRFVGKTFEVEAVLEQEQAPLSNPELAQAAPETPAPIQQKESEPPPSVPEQTESPAEADKTPQPKTEAPGAASSETRASHVETALSAPGALGAYGESGAAAATTNLTKALTKAIPPATKGDPAWLSLPNGAAGSFTVGFEVDAYGQIVRAEPVEIEVPGVLSRLLARLLILLKGGRFALKAEEVSAGHQLFRIEANIRQEAPSRDRNAIGMHVARIGAEYPTNTTPGRAFFTFNSGRHVELTVEPVER